MTGKEQHADRAHAVLSASSASRWLNCTPSARLSEGLYQESSKAADEGTLAHELAENELRKYFGLISEVDYNNRFRELRKSPHFYVEILQDLEPYISLVIEQVNEARAMHPKAVILIETKLSLEKYISEGFGTCDIIIISGNWLWVTDLKFGRGVRVSAVDNPQLKLYALAALIAYGLLYDIEHVRLTIAQPRLDAVSVFDITADEIYKWADEVVKPKAVEAFEGKGEAIVGSWCRYCKAQSLCPAMREKAIETVQLDFQPPKELVDELELLQVYEFAEIIEGYLAAVKAHVYRRAIEGMKWPGMKLVEGKSNRTIPEPDKVIKALKKGGYDMSVFVRTTTSLVGLTELEKFLGKAKMAEVVGPFIVKPQGKPTLVDESDKRDEINANPADDFL